MYGFAFVAFIRIVLRTARALGVIGRLIVDRDTVRALPWRYIRARVRGSRLLSFKLFGCFAAITLLPAAAISPSLASLGVIGLGIWAVAVLLR